MLKRLALKLMAVACHNATLQGYNPNKLWTPDYVAWLEEQVQKRCGNLPVLDVIADFVVDAGTVLDVGCGWMIYQPDCRYTGVDVSPAMLRRAMDLHLGTKLVLCSAFNLPFPDKTFDAVRSTGMLRHLRDWKPALHEMLRVTRHKLAFTHLVGAGERQCGRHQWHTTADAIVKELPSEPRQWVVRRWKGRESVLFTVTL